jgi:hypothetical protein
MKMKYQGRDGLFPEHAEVQFIMPTLERVRLTIPAREELERVGATIIQTETNPPLFSVTLDEIAPNGIVATRIGNTDHLGLRLEIEPEYPMEIGHAYWEQVSLTPCPVCGACLIWYEAGYVPGYRVCVRKPHHHCMPEDFS